MKSRWVHCQVALLGLFIGAMACQTQRTRVEGASEAARDETGSKTDAPVVTGVGSQAEWLRPREVVVHTPGEEVFVGVVHPAAALFERAFSLSDAAREHEGYVSLLEKSGARVHRLVDILLDGTLNENDRPVPGDALTALQDFAKQFLTYDTSSLPQDLRDKQEQIREQVIRTLHPRELVKAILQQPKVRLQSTGGLNTGYTASYELNPVMNMYFMRDQVITTAKGVVLGRFNAVQREVESKIAKYAYAKLGVRPIYEVTGSARLEGGDFIPAGDVAFLGQGLRTNAEAVRQLLEARVFGARWVVIVKEPWKNQDQMHLDTYFNVMAPRLAVLVESRLDLKDASGKVIKQASPERRLSVDVYELSGDRYVRRIDSGDFQEYVEKTLGYRLIPVSDEDQLKYGINFLTVGEKKLLGIDGVSQEYKDRLAREGVDVTWMDFYHLTGGYGAAHCTVQAIFRK